MRPIVWLSPRWGSMKCFPRCKDMMLSFARIGMRVKSETGETDKEGRNLIDASHPAGPIRQHPPGTNRPDHWTGPGQLPGYPWCQRRTTSCRDPLGEPGWETQLQSDRPGQQHGNL